MFKCKEQRVGPKAWCWSVVIELTLRFKLRMETRSVKLFWLANHGLGMGNELHRGLSVH